ncbi:hypothetical protein EBB07_30910 [Paenibacillaceae bacterium]|nr:hypothetical protein EBB07_30910 [Paenibacillaceae bacterium]
MIVYPTTRRPCKQKGRANIGVGIETEFRSTVTRIQKRSRTFHYA